MKVINEAFKSILVFMMIRGLIHPVSMIGALQLPFKEEASSSTIEANGRKYGSVLLTQEFTGDKYLWGCVINLDTSTLINENEEVLMYAVPSNLNSVNEEYGKLVSEKIEKTKTSNPDKKNEPIPVDSVTSSESGLNPHISAITTEYQAERITKAHNIGTDEVEQIIEKYTKRRALRVSREETVSVLQVSLALDEKL